MNLISRTLLATTAALSALAPLASSHREAPLITTTPKLDAADFYMFNSYEPGRENYVTVVANYLPLQDAYGGPNFFTLDPNALYEIHIDNNGDALEDLTFQFRFTNTPRDVALPIGPAGNQKTNAVPVLAVGPIGAGNTAALNLDQTYTVSLIRGNRRTGTAAPVTRVEDGSATFTKPIDNIGEKTIPDYAAYASSYIYNIRIPGCDQPGKLFVGQRKDPFVVNLGETFDLINISTSPIGPPDKNVDILADKNITSLILELPKSCLLSDPNKPVIGGWTTSSQIVKDAGGAHTNQVSRLGQPLVNEVVIGLKDKDKFNASEPKDDAQFADYVTHPTLPAIIELLFGSAGVKAPTAFPRSDLVAIFLTGIDGLNKNGSVSEMLRLNTAIPAVPPSQQKNLGVIAGDKAGFPNGRRPGDDVVDIALRAVMGVLLPASDAPSGQLPFTDGAEVNALMFPAKFPYLNNPIAGSPNEPTVTLSIQSAPRVQGPYQSIPVTVDPGTGKLTGAKPDPKAGFFRAKSDRKIQLNSVESTGDSVRFTVK